MCDVRFAYIDPADISGRLIRNPNYGGPSVGPYGWTWRSEINKTRGAKPGFIHQLRDSISSEGVRNPVLVWNFPEGLFLTFGGSRVVVAQELGVEAIPAIINDYTGAFGQASLVTADNLESYFTDLPRDYEFTDKGFDYHYNLERARRANHDPAGFAWVEDDPSWIEQEFPWLKD